MGGHLANKGRARRVVMANGMKSEMKGISINSVLGCGCVEA